jgi:dTDP-4-amino-4,6-dideoxygalactose transaminase
MTNLALLGGKPVRRVPWPRYNTIGDEEKRAVNEVLDSGVLSGYIAYAGPEFYGGQRVQRLERAAEDYFGIKYAVGMNSATSCLYAAVGAAGIGPGDEVIVSPYTMTASATCVLVYNAIPVFADISPDTFCLDPASVRKAITPRTKAIVVVDLFGQPAEMDAIMDIAREHDLIVIEDAAQAPGAMDSGRYAGTMGHIGVFSLNYHKTIHSGEGGIAVTNDGALAERMQLIRNHAEVIVKDKGIQDISNMVGFNYRMTEIEASIAFEQLKKLDGLVLARQELAGLLTQHLGQFPAITTPVVREDVAHGWYVYSIKYDAKVAGIPRDLFVKALNAEGIPMFPGYTEPIYRQPLYQNRIAFGSLGCPFTCGHYSGHVSYEKGLCPVAERMYDDELMFTTACAAGVSTDDIADIANAFEKVLANSKELAGASAD